MALAAIFQGISQAAKALADEAARGRAQFAALQWQRQQPADVNAALVSARLGHGAIISKELMRLVLLVSIAAASDPARPGAAARALCNREDVQKDAYDAIAASDVAVGRRNDLLTERDGSFAVRVVASIFGSPVSPIPYTELCRQYIAAYEAQGRLAEKVRAICAAGGVTVDDTADDTADAAAVAAADAADTSATTVYMKLLLATNPDIRTLAEDAAAPRIFSDLYAIHWQLASAAVVHTVVYADTRA
jgi:hypothetical protein